jgi:hypothetical protein
VDRSLTLGIDGQESSFAGKLLEHQKTTGQLPDQLPLETVLDWMLDFVKSDDFGTLKYCARFFVTY